MSFTQTLKENGWSEVEGKFKYLKGSWQLVFDTSSWMEVGTKHTPRIFDVPVPKEDLEQWTLTLIEHLCKTDDLLSSRGAN